MPSVTSSSFRPAEAAADNVGEIGGQLNQLEESITSVMELANRLQNSVSPVLASEGPTAKSSNTIPVLDSPLANRIQTLNVSLQGAAATLQNIIDRVRC